MTHWPRNHLSKRVNVLHQNNLNVITGDLKLSDWILRFQSLGKRDKTHTHTRNLPSIAMVLFLTSFLLDVRCFTCYSPRQKNQFGRNLQREKYLQFEMVENSEGKWKGGWWVLESVMESKWTFVKWSLWAFAWGERGERGEMQSMNEISFPRQLKLSVKVKVKE